MTYDIIISSDALQDIQQAINYYDDQQAGLGKKFEMTLNTHFISLKKNPFFQVHYDNIRCLPLRKYPYTIHFTLDEKVKTIIIRAVFHTSLDPEKWKIR